MVTPMINMIEDVPHNQSNKIWLWLMRALWMILTTLSISLIIANLSSRYEQLATVSPYSSHWAYWLRSAEATALTQWGWTLQGYATYVLAFQLLGMGAYCVIAFVIFWSGRRDPYRIFLSLALITFITSESSVTDALVVKQAQWDPLVNALQAIAYSTIPLIYYLFPDGRFVPRWTRPFAYVWITLMAIWYFFPAAPFNPVYGDTWEQTPWLSLLVTGFWPLSGVVAQVIRYFKYADVAQRQQTQWVVIGFAFATLGGLIHFVPPLHPALQTPGLDTLRLEVMTLPFATLLMVGWPLSLSYAIVRHHLWDTFVNRAFVFGLLILSIFGLYILVVNIMNALLGPFGAPFTAPTATTFIAVIVTPLREWLQRAVNRRMYGQRDEPYAVISQLSKRLATLAPNAVLRTIVETVAQALRLPFAAIELTGDDGRRTEFISPSVVTPPPIDQLTRLLLTYQNETIGLLILAPRAPNEPFSPADLRLLDDLARQIGVAAHDVKLNADLQRSREQLVLAREEERRRLRRDLHDGLGPQLAGQMLTLDATSKQLTNNPAAAAELLQALKAQSQDAMAYFRRHVANLDNLRPPALDSLGLVGALREQAARFSITANGQPPLHVSIDAPEPLPPLSAAVEVAIYHIAREALTNVVRHAQARTCQVQLTVGDTFDVVITDDGIGLPANYRAGVGLESMRERAAELGGQCLIERFACGTRVRARLPMRKEE